MTDYSSFRTGLTYRTVYEMLAAERRRQYHQTGQYNGWPGRRSVLGRWRELKQAMYWHYVDITAAEGGAPVHGDRAHKLHAECDV